MALHWPTFCGALLLAAAVLPSIAKGDETPKRIRAGIIGLDTSHVIAFSETFLKPEEDKDLAAIEIVAAYPGGSPDLDASRDRVQGYTDQLRRMGIKIVDSIEALLELVDVVLLESVDGRPHLEQARPVIAAGKRMFIDKPVAGSLADAIEIFRLAEAAKLPIFSSSSLRFSPGILGVRADDTFGEVLGCLAYSPCPLEPHHPDLFWYGVHGVETLFTIMGTGCVSVSRVQTADADLVTGVWKDGRVGQYRGIRAGAADYGATVFGKKRIGPSGGYAGYRPLVVEIARFFQTGLVPVPPDETIEIFAFMEAADESKRQGGASVTLESVIAKARAQHASKP